MEIKEINRACSRATDGEALKNERDLAQQNANSSTDENGLNITWQPQLHKTVIGTMTDNVYDHQQMQCV